MFPGRRESLLYRVVDFCSESGSARGRIVFAARDQDPAVQQQGRRVETSGRTHADGSGKRAWGLCPRQWAVAGYAQQKGRKNKPGFHLLSPKSTWK